MSVMQFSKEQLINLDFSRSREWLQANDKGAYSSSTLVNCHTRKYHGLFVAPQPQLDDKMYVLLSSLDETILYRDKKIQLATHDYPGTCFPEGYRYLEDFSYSNICRWNILADDFQIRKELLFVKGENQLLIKYTLTETKHNSVQMMFNPLLAFRNIHAVSKANINVNRKTENVSNGIRLKMYAGFDDLFLQLSKKAVFVNAPDWYYHHEYSLEKERGYEFQDDLYCPGYFKLSLKKGEQIIFSVSLTETNPRKIKGLFESELKNDIQLRDFKECLEHAAEQFITSNNNGTEVIAGFHWFGRWGRDTFISLPGLTLATGKFHICKAVLDTMLKELKDGLFPNTGYGQHAAYNTADASLWFFWALQLYAARTASIVHVWKEYGTKMKFILKHYRKGTLHAIHMENNGLLYAGEPGTAVTWMDAMADGKPVTARTGMPVELNALWYNAVCFSLEAASAAGEQKFIDEWKSLPAQIESSFVSIFWDEEKGYLADCVNGHQKDWSFRPNQVIAISLPYSPLNDNMKNSVLEKTEEKLLTPRGLRTLAPGEENYKGCYAGDQRTRDMAYHQGTAWPWLSGHFAEAYLKIHGKNGLPFVQTMYKNFASAINEYGIGTIAEVYDGDAPYKAGGAISQAWSVAELLRMGDLINTCHKQAEAEKMEIFQMM